MRLLIGSTFLISLISTFTQAQPDTKDFIEDLLSKMTLEEKIGQMVMYTGGWDVTGPIVSTDNLSLIEQGQVGAMLNVYSTEGTERLQKIAVEKTRLGIPLLFGYDVIHGQRTIFPINLGSAASFDLELIEESARIAAKEASAEGLHWTFAPMVDLARDPRWGRISEGSGEDVYLGIEISKAYVRGFQGDDLSHHNTILACAKHFVGYGAAQAGRDYHTVDLSERSLREDYLPPFKAAVDQGVATFMTAFNELNGIPATGSKELFKDILRTEWGFDGFVVSDYTAINEMVAHGFAHDDKDAARLALDAGVDMDMMGSVYRLYLPSLIENGKIDVQQVDEACRVILKAKYELGLFEDPYRYIDKAREDTILYHPDHLDAARKLAAASSVLLKNEGRLLPLGTSQKIALIGPLVRDEESIIGNWAAAGDRFGRAVSILEGFSEYVDTTEILYARGCDIESSDESGFAEAVEIAGEVDVVVMVMGEHYHMSGEAASRTSIKLPGVQSNLIAHIRKEHPSKKIVLVLMNGRPLDLSDEVTLTDAILEVWFPGTMGGAGVADVLFGIYNPSAKLPVSFPRNVGQVPIYYNYKNTGRPVFPDNPKQDYRSFYQDAPNDPLFPFGFGLSYTEFDYSPVTISDSVLANNGELQISVEVENTGERAGHEIVQLYIRDLVGSVTRPVRQLKGFQKIFLNPGDKTTVRFTLSTLDLAFYNQEMQRVAEPGQFHVFVGGDSQTGNQATFRLAE